MTGIGSTELFVIALMTMIVIGPKNIKPILKFIKEISWRIKKYAYQLREDVGIQDEMEGIKAEMEAVIKSTKDEIDLDELQDELILLKGKTEKCIEMIENDKKERRQV